MASENEECVCFYMGKFIPQQPNLMLDGDAAVSTEGKLRLTKIDEHGEPANQTLGRARYITPIHIWDNNNDETRNVASFVTCFSFTIHAPDKTKTADGLTFFLQPQDYELKDGGGYLGLFNAGKSGPVVAVEFDTFRNTNPDIDDPIAPHIGLDFKRIRSRNTVPWEFQNDTETFVCISYDGSAKALDATLFHDEVTYYKLPPQIADLRDALPEWVRVGFSAATGEPDPQFVETHDVNFWSFASCFKHGPATLAEALKGVNPRLATFLPLHFEQAK